MTPEIQAQIWELVKLIVLAVIGYLVKKQSGEIATVKQDVGDVKQVVQEVKLTVDPLTGVLDGQLTEMKREIRLAANQAGRSELLAEQKAEQAMEARGNLQARSEMAEEKRFAESSLPTSPDFPTEERRSG